MDTEFRGLLGSDKKAAGAKVTEYREEYRLIVENFKATRAKAEAAALTSSNGAREKLLTANQKLDRSTAALEQSRMLVAQTEGIGNTITSDLESQREMLQSAKTKVQETKQFTYSAKGVLQVMSRRNVYHKIILICIILALFAGIVTIIYFGFVKKKN
jgi:vesicle transport through interaction with t-SNAREs protein 1